MNVAATVNSFIKLFLRHRGSMHLKSGSEVVFMIIFLIVFCPGAVESGGLPDYDFIIKGGTIYDGEGGQPYRADIGIRDDVVVAIGNLGSDKAGMVINADNLAVAPGFINVLSWAMDSLLIDGRSLSNLRQGVTLEIFGEGLSAGPLTDAMKTALRKQLGDPGFNISWTTLGEYLDYLAKKGVSPNVASFVGATTVRINVLGYDNRKPNAKELEKMRGLIRTAMEEGALGVGSALGYTPAVFADTRELIELARVAGEYNGVYISHIRSESDHVETAVEELLTIAREANVAAEIYHLKAAGKANWSKLDKVIARIAEARSTGLKISADIYTYAAGASGLDAMMPPWVQEGGMEAWVERLKDPAVRKQLIKEMNQAGAGWDNAYLAAGSADRILLIGFKNEQLRSLTGMTLADVAGNRGVSPQEAAMDLVIEDGSRVAAVYFTMSPDNVRKKIALPWVSFGSDEGSYAAVDPFTLKKPHPRAYGNFARLLGHYVREEKVISLSEAVRKLTSLPADNFNIRKRGRLKTGHYADIVVFDPDSIQDHASYEDPHQYATGVVHVFVNGKQVLRDGEHTGVFPGRVVRGPGWRGWSE